MGCWWSLVRIQSPRPNKKLFKSPAFAGLFYLGRFLEKACFCKELPQIKTSQSEVLNNFLIEYLPPWINAVNPVTPLSDEAFHKKTTQSVVVLFFLVEYLPILDHPVTPLSYEAFHFL
jgi:hypothetical protein